MIENRMYVLILSLLWIPNGRIDCFSSSRSVPNIFFSFRRSLNSANPEKDDVAREKNLYREPTIVSIQSQAEIVDLKVRNMYESQVLASMGTIERGRRITKYYCCTDAPNLLRDISKNIIASLSKEAIDSNYFDKLLKIPILDRSQDFECDLYVNIAADNLGSSDETSTVSQLLRAATTEIRSLNDFSPDDVDCSSKWLLIEISESPRLSAHTVRSASYKLIASSS